ncbi:MAG: 4Fe-4S dicluster domain-containing protein [Lachnospiraceae bacterium]|nr:4Fe-4S dicluster domain-containing protein [Lachnospiraceae bacterium]
MKIEERASTHVYRQKQMLSKQELEQIESLCVHEQPAYCVAACPLKLDTKAMIEAIKAGNFDKALQLYEKITPFPHILSSGCEAPCEGTCKLCSLGDGISIRQLEESAVLYGEKSKAKGFMRFKKKKTTALFGSGLFITFLAGELAKKTYPVTVFCSEEDHLAFLNQETAFLPNAHLDAALSTLKAQDISFVFAADPVKAYEEHASEYDVVGASYAVASALYPDLEVDEAVMVYREKKLVTGNTNGVLSAAFGAKKAALSVDRLAQNLDPSNTRGEEGPVETNLYTSLDGVAPSKKITASDVSYTKEEAIAEASRCISCHCDECIKGCAYLQHYQKFPRILTREIYNNVSIIMGDHMMNKPINACSLCGQCKITCPNGYDMGAICQMARENMVSTGKMPLAPHEFALMDMIFSNEEAFLALPQPGYDTCKYVFFPGCQASAIAPETIRAAYLDLCSRLEGGVALMLGCCGAICDWAGRYELYGQTKEFINRELGKLGDPIIIAGCPTCKKELSSHAPSEIKGIWDILNEIGLPENTSCQNQTLALHDSCGARGDAETQNAIRTLIASTGCHLVDTPYSGDRSPCCGYGGLTAYSNREVAKKMTEKCLERSDEAYLTYCMACRDRFAREGRSSSHILELLYGVSASECPDISEKRYNRLNLRNKLLKELWNQEVTPVELGFTVTYTDEARAMMDDRMILDTDVIRVLQSLRETDEAIFDEETGLSIARARLGNVTFWVKYKETDDGYLIVSAYSHRMNIVNRL